MKLLLHSMMGKIKDGAAGAAMEAPDVRRREQGMQENSARYLGF